MALKSQFSTVLMAELKLPVSRGADNGVKYR